MWLRFETEAPVDDLLVKTTDGGFVAIQAKTTISLSNDPRSPWARQSRSSSAIGSFASKATAAWNGTVP